MGAAPRTIVAIIVVAVAAIAFWALALSPQRDEASKLAAQAEQLTSTLAAAKGELAQATAAEHAFPAAYRQLVDLGQAIPATDETPSLLVELETIAVASGVKFNGAQLEGEGSAAPPPVVATPEPTESSTGATPAAATIPPTEVEASLLPLGASIGSAGLAVMPYTLQLEGGFFQIADFIGAVDSLVRSGKSMTVDGRLVTIDSFSLTPEAGGEGSETAGSTRLHATFSVTTYLTPPGQGVTAGATASEPAIEPASESVAAE
jgi:Tfp pilus assembly protein PilO